VNAAHRREEIIRGVILDILIQHRLEWVASDSLRLEILRGQGFVLSSDDLLFHAAYLADQSRRYVEILPLRGGRDQFQIRATAKAVDLHDERIPADPGVMF